LHKWGQERKRKFSFSITVPGLILTRETIVELGWTVLPHLPYSLYLASSDFHLFCLMKDGLCGKHFTNDDVIVVVRQWLLKANSNFKM
jgi:hypothetical protein